VKGRGSKGWERGERVRGSGRGRQGEKRGGRARLGYLYRGPRVCYATARSAPPTAPGYAYEQNGNMSDDSLKNAANIRMMRTWA